MSAWNLIGDQAQVMTPAASVTPTSTTTRPVKCSASVGLGQRYAGALLRQLHGQQVQRVVHADAHAERDHRQRRDLHADAQPHHQRLAQDGGHHQRNHRHEHGAPAAEGEEAQQRSPLRRRRAASCDLASLHDDVGGGLDAGAAGGQQELAIRRVWSAANFSLASTTRSSVSALWSAGRRSAASPSTRC